MTPTVKKSSWQYKRVTKSAALYKKHGLKGTKEYKTWICIRSRCLNPRRAQAKDYIHRGITICDRWNNFLNFYQDMGVAPSPQHTIDRIDNSKGYSPDNCRWATRKEQQRNTRRSRFIEINGERKTVAEWCEIFNVSRSAVNRRLEKHSDPLKIFAPVRGRAA